MIYDNNRPETLRSLVFLCIFVLFVGYGALNIFVPNADMIISVRVLAVGFYTAVLYVYGGDAWRAIRSPNPGRSGFLIFGIWLSFLSHLLQCLYSIIYRLAPSEWLLYSEVVSPIVLLSVIAAVLHVGAPGSVDGVVPRKNKVSLGVSVGFAAIVLVGIIASKPNIRPYIQELKPYIGDFWGPDERSDRTPDADTSPWREWRQGTRSHGGSLPLMP